MQKYVRGQVWFMECDTISVNTIGKVRPCIIISNNDANKVNRCLTVIPLSSNNGCAHINQYGCLKIGERIVLVNQMRAIGTEKVRNYLGTISAEEMSIIDDNIHKYLFTGGLENFNDWIENSNSGEEDQHLQEAASTQTEQTSYPRIDRHAIRSTQQNNVTTPVVIQETQPDQSTKSNTIKSVSKYAKSMSTKQKEEFCDMFETQGFSKTKEHYAISTNSVYRWYESFCLELERVQKVANKNKISLGSSYLRSDSKKREFVVAYSKLGATKLADHLGITAKAAYQRVVRYAKQLGMEVPKQTPKQEEPVNDRTKEFKQDFIQHGVEYCADKYKMTTSEVRDLYNCRNK